MTKRIVSLLIAVMLVVGIFAVPAMAAQEDDGIELYGPMMRCDNCGASVPTSNYETWAENGTVYKGCGKTSDLHAHFQSFKCTGLRCNSCGTWITTTRVLITDGCSIGKV